MEGNGDPGFDIERDLLCTAGTNGHFQSLNAAWERVLGWSREELMQRPMIDFVHQDRRRRVALAPLERALGWSDLVRGRVRRHTPQGGRAAPPRRADRGTPRRVQPADPRSAKRRRRPGGVVRTAPHRRPRRRRHRRGGVPARGRAIRPVAIARELGLRTVAERVEDEPTLRLLREFGVDHVQGYLIGRPQPLVRG